MRILEINKFNFLKRGAEKHFLDLVSLLENEGHQVAVFSMKHEQNKKSPWENYFPSYVGYSREDSWKDKLKGLGRIFFSPESRGKIKKILDDFDPQIVHIHNIYHQISPSILGEIKKRNIPVVMTVHDYNLISPNYNLSFKGTDWEKLGKFKSLKFILRKGFKNSYIKSILAILEHFFVKLTKVYDKNIDLYISPSEFVKEKLISHGTKKEKIIVLPHFSTAKVRENTKETSGSVLYFGNISQEKGSQILLETIQDLREIDFQLAGQIEKDINFPKLSNLKNLGFLDQENLKKTIQESLFVISTSRLPETFGLTALEAIENGKPFVGFDSGALGEIIENSKEGFLCKTNIEFKEKIKKLYFDKNLRKEMSQNALKKAAFFGSERYKKRLLEIFKNLLTKK